MEQLIDPKTLARVRDMPLIAKTVADGFLHGVQTSNQKGVGIEFSQYRSYEPGDELNLIDWKLFARSDRYFVREAQRSSETTLWLLVDGSASMSQQSTDGRWNKLDYARHLAATLAYVAQCQGDHIGLLGLSVDEPVFLPPGDGERHWQRIMAQLLRIKAGNVFPSPDVLKRQLNRLQQPAMVVLISDFYQPGQEISDFVGKISNSANEVVALQLQSADELNFPYKGIIRFKDLESHEEVLVSGKAVKDHYFNALYQHQQQLKKQLAAMRVELTNLSIDQPMDQALFSYLKLRQRSWR